jgi:xanthine dehydrogenase YagS FAD-binding subunit
MKAFTFVRPATLEEAATAAVAKGTVIKAGGIDLLDRMKERIDQPDRVVALDDVKAPDPLRGIGTSARDGGKADLKIGALVTLAEIAASARLQRECAALAEAASLAASPQIRARATLAGNLLQHTRCGYYRLASFPCWRRGDDACPVLADGAVQDTAAIFGNRPCASAHPSSLAPVLAALDATIYVTAPGGGAMDANVDALFLPFRLGMKKGTRIEVLLPEGGVVTHVTIPQVDGRRAAYEEVRQKAAFDWALASCCVRLDMDGGKVVGSGISLGSVAPIPWRAEGAEKALAGKPLSDETIAAAADAAVDGATPLPGNAYKVDLVKVVVRRALERLRSMK